MDRDYSKINSAAAAWLVIPSARAVYDAITRGGFEIFYVGGCVRNALLGAPVSDVDMSTNATPEQVIALTKAAGLNPVPTGIEHGTITVVSGGMGYEVTTFRRDVETDGRRAVVAFSDDISDDARRRDFTMNALYADAEGNVIDPLGSIDDLRARRVRFIEDADTRIREDYLRALRYFRFHAWYGDTANGMDEDALAAIASNIDGLETLSAERIGAEMQKLLSANDASTTLGAMAQTGVLGTIMPGTDVRFVMLMIHGEDVLHHVPNWLGRLVALGGEDIPKRLRLSKAQERDYDRIKGAAFDDISLSETANSAGAEIATQAYLIRCAISETAPKLPYLTTLTDAAAQKFPVTAADLMPAYQGPALGVRLAQLKSAWIASDFQMTKQELISIPAP